MSKLLRMLHAFFSREQGASIVEYAVGLLLIAVVTVTGIAVLGNVLSNFFTNAATSI
jgi:Flp pilus assembly pilin Flp